MKSYKFTINGRKYEVAVNGIEGKNADVTVNGVNYSVELEDAPQTAPVPEAPKAAAPVAEAPQAGAATASRDAVTVTSPLPGVIISVDVRIGQNVKRGQKVAVLEAMKMENEILSGADGIVKEIHVQKGESVLEGATIVTVG